MRTCCVLCLALCCSCGPSGTHATAARHGAVEVSPNLVVLPWAGYRAAVSYTFDDSTPSQINHYAELQAAGVPVTFYLTTRNASHPAYDATWKAALLDGHELGNHTVHHCYFDQGCSGAMAGSAAAEIDAATTYMKERLGLAEVRTMAYPFGDAAYAPLARDRFFLGRGVRGGAISPDEGDPFDLPVFAARGGESEVALSAVIDAARAGGKWVIFLFHSLAPDAEAWYAPVDVASVTGSMAHASAVGDTWVDTVAHVGAYWLGARLLRSARITATGSSRTWTWTLPPHAPPSSFVRVTIDGGALEQHGRVLARDAHGYYEVALDAGTLTWKSP